MKVEKPGDRSFLKTLIYAPSGHGKTTLLGTAQADSRTSPMLILDFEGGLQSLAGLDIDTIHIDSWDGFYDVYDELVKGKHNYKSVAIDSITEVHTFSLLTILAEEGPTRKDDAVLQMQDYGKSTIQMRRLLRAFRDLPLHVFFTALAKETTDPREGTIKVPALGGQLAEEVPAMQDIVAYLALEKKADGQDALRTLLLKNIPRFRCKIRTGWNRDVPDFIDSPTITSLLDALRVPQVQSATGGKK